MTNEYEAGKYIGVKYTVHYSETFGYSFRCIDCDDTRDGFDTEDSAHTAAVAHISRYANQTAYRS
jgi:hypothetical protein